MHRIHYIVGYEKCMVSYYVIYAQKITIKTESM